MGKAVVDPAELRRFAQDLRRFNLELDTLLGALRGRLHGLGHTWQDQEHRRFLEAFEGTVRMLGQFLEASEGHAAFLQKKAAAAEAYLQQR